MIVDRATIDKLADRILQKVSPSQVDLFEVCERRWYNAHVRGLKEEMTPAALRGTNVATVVEDYYLDGTEPEGHPKFADLAHLARPIIKLYGPRRPGIFAEEWVEVETESGLPIIRGRFDWFQSVPEQWKLDHEPVPMLADTKCRSSFRYAKTEDPKDGDEKYIGADQQLNTYSMALVRGLDLPKIGLMHGYSLTDARRKPQGKGVSVILTAEQLLPRFRKTVESVRKMAYWAKERPDTAEPLEANTTACRKFPPKGCPYRALCGLDGGQTSWAADPENDKKENVMSDRNGPSLMDRMKAKKAGATNGAASPPPANDKPASEPTNGKSEDHELSVARAKKAIADGRLKHDANDQIFTKDGADTGWILRKGTVAELEALGVGAAPAPQKPEEQSVRPPDAPNPASGSATDEPKKSRKPPRNTAAAKPEGEQKTETKSPEPDKPVDKPAGTETTRAAADEAAASRAKAPKVVVLVDTIPTKGEHHGKAVDYNEWLEPLFAEVSKSLGLVDWRLDFANKSEGALAAAIRANLHKLPPVVSVSGFSKARAVFLECVTPIAGAVYKGTTG